MWITIVLLVLLMIPLMAVILDSQVGRALAARLEREDTPVPDGLGDRIVALEAEVDRLAGTLQRVEEQHDFLQKLLLERPATGGALPSGERDD